MKEVMNYRGYKIQINTLQSQSGVHKGEWSGAYKFWTPANPKIVHIAGCGSSFSSELAARAKAVRCALMSVDEQVEASYDRRRAVLV
jgi:hypothetical protein